jgi:hypothetical protein
LKIKESAIDREIKNKEKILQNLKEKDEEDDSEEGALSGYNSA